MSLSMVQAGFEIPILLIALLIALYTLRLQQRNRTLRRERAELRQEKEVTLGFVENVSQVFTNAESVEMDQLLRRVLHYAVRTCKAGSGAIYLLDKRGKYLHARALSGVIPPLFELHAELVPEANSTESLHQLLIDRRLRRGETVIGEVATQGSALLIEDAELDARIPQLPIDFLRIRTLLLTPMRFGNEVIGVMVLANRTGNNRFSLSDLSLSQALAAQASVPIHYAELQEALEEKRQLDRDMQIARQIQHSLLPQELPALPGVELAGFNHPALDIGGDYYDVIEINEHQVAMVIADVSGKGIGGALMMAVCRSVIQAEAPQHADPAAMLIRLNETLSVNLAEDMFISMLYMVLNTQTHELSIARAGHEAPLILHRDNPSVDRTESSGIAIGLVDAITFSSIIETVRVQLHPGDLVLTYTDGITEAMNAQDEEWGIDNLIEVIENQAANSAAEMIKTIEKEVLHFAGNRPQHDDMTLLAIHLH